MRHAIESNPPVPQPGMVVAVAEELVDVVMGGRETIPGSVDEALDKPVRWRVLAESGDR